MRITIGIRSFTEGYAVSPPVFKILKKYDVSLKLDRFSATMPIIEAREGVILHDFEVLYDIAYRHRQKFLAEMKLVS